MNRFWLWLKFAMLRLQGKFPDWQKVGKFTNTPEIEWRGPRNYYFRNDPNALFSFERGLDADKFVPSGEVIIPGDMQTDGGSVPRVVWFTGLDPWVYLPAYLIHDWEFEEHHLGGVDKSLEQVNLTLLEAVYTLMKTDMAPMNPFHLRLIWDGVASPIGQEVWDGSWLKK